MLPILLVLGATGALLEIKRLVNRPPQDGDAFRLKQSEERLRRVLQEVQQELQRTQAEQQKDHQRAEELQKTADNLRRAEADLQARSQELQQKTIKLDNEVEELQNQVRTMHVQHDAEMQEQTAKLKSHFESVKKGVASLFEDFGRGNIDASNLLGELERLGVDVQVAPEVFKALPSEAKERPEARKLELRVDSDFRSQLRLVSDYPERMAKLVAEGASRGNTPLQLGATERFPSVKTPPSVRKDASIFSTRGRLSAGLQTAPSSEDKENASRQPLSDVTPPTQSSPGLKLLANKDSKNTSSRRHVSIPKLSIAKSAKQPVKNMPSRESFALADLNTEPDTSPMMRHSALGF